MMRPLLLLTLMHILRSRVLVMLVMFTLVVQHLAIRVARSVTLHIQDTIQVVGENEALFVGVLVQGFAAAFVTFVYGTWMVPYLHRGGRAALTHTFPVSRWAYPAAYGLTLLGVLALQNLLLLVNLALIFGPASLGSGTVAWGGLALCFLYQALMAVALLFAVATASMIVGALPGFILMSLVAFVLEVGGLVFRPSVEDVLGGRPEWFTRGQWIFDKLPPVALVPFDLRDALFDTMLNGWRTGLWAFWGLAAAVAFYLVLRHPMKVRGAEGE